MLFNLKLVKSIVIWVAPLMFLLAANIFSTVNKQPDSNVDINQNQKEEGIHTIPVDYVWVSLIVIVNILFFARKGILAKHGFGFLPFDYGMDRKRLKEIIERETMPQKKNLYKWLNILIPGLFVLALLIAILRTILVPW